MVGLKAIYFVRLITKSYFSIKINYLKMLNYLPKKAVVILMCMEVNLISLFKMP